jgi:hypothetical protein
MSIAPDASEVQSLQLKLSLASDPSTGAYEVTIEFCDIEVAVEVLDVDLRRAIRTAADRCAERLRGHGYLVTSEDVIGALEVALESSEFARAPAQALN